MLTMWNNYFLVKQDEIKLSNVIETDCLKSNSGIVKFTEDHHKSLLGHRVWFDLYTCNKVVLNNNEYLAVQAKDIICVE